MSPGAIRSLADEPEPERYIEATLPWIYEAGDRYFDWLLDGPERARPVIAAWMERDSSEISIRRVVAMFEGDQPVGGFVGLSGAELERCARADSLLALKAVGRDRRRMLLERAAAVADLRQPVEPDQWFLSKLGVLPQFRRAGRGGALIGAFLEAGRRAGFDRFRLDVHPEDAGTVRLYESAGFEVVHESRSEAAGMRLYAMALDG